MADTIGNPLSWISRHIGGTGAHMAAAADELRGKTHAPPQVKTMHMSDIAASLRAGWDDFAACRSDVMAIVLIYPIAGLVLVGMGFQMNLLPLLFPLLTGFAILGPLAAVGLYEMSRRREAGETPRWGHAIGAFLSPAFGAIFVMGVYLVALFLLWMLTAAEIYAVTLGPEQPASLSAFAADVLGTSAGWTMIVLGFAAGLVFALVALAVSVVSFPLMLDRHVGAAVAVTTSVEVFRRNPAVVLAWGALIAVSLAIGAVPMLLGLIIVLPVLGHASWHFYRRAVA